LTLLSDLIGFLHYAGATGQGQSRGQRVILLLLIAPVWLVALWVVGGLCLAARAGDRMPSPVEDSYVLEHTRQGDPLAPRERADEQWQPHAPAVAAGRRAA
jgi:hypothetical protein